MILLHALGERGGGALERFSETHRAITIRGHGRSDWPGEYSVSLMSDDVGAVLDGLGMRDVVLVGHSLGGVVAILTLDSGHHVHRARPGDFCDLLLGWLVAECN
jgi:hypothetical protein